MVIIMTIRSTDIKVLCRMNALLFVIQLYFSVDQSRWFFVFSLVSAFIFVPMSIIIKSRLQLILAANCVGVPFGAAVGLRVSTVRPT